MAVWWVWVFTSWVTNWLDPEQPPVRLLLLVLMLAGLVLSTSLPEAFGDKGLAFAAAFTFMQVGRSAFVLWVLGSSNPGLTRNFQRICAWLVLSGLFWIAGGLADDRLRLGLWAMALGIEYLSRRHWAFACPGSGPRGRATGTSTAGNGRALRPVRHHRARRVRSWSRVPPSPTWPGTARASPPSSLPSSAASTMWWICSSTLAPSGAAGTSRRRRIRAASRVATHTFIHLLIVAGIVVVAVGDELLLAHPLGHLEPAAAYVLLGGPALYLLGNALFKHTVMGRLPLSHLVGLALLGLLAIGATSTSPLFLGARHQRRTRRRRRRCGKWWHSAARHRLWPASIGGNCAVDGMALA